MKADIDDVLRIKLSGELVQVIEDRGNLGFGGRRILRVRSLDNSIDNSDYEPFEIAEVDTEETEPS